MQTKQSELQLFYWRRSTIHPAEQEEEEETGRNYLVERYILHVATRQEQRMMMSQLKLRLNYIE